MNFDKLHLPRYVLYNTNTDSIICAFNDLKGVGEHIIKIGETEPSTTIPPQIKRTAPLTVSENYSPSVINRVGKFGGRGKL